MQPIRFEFPRAFGLTDHELLYGRWLADQGHAGLTHESPPFGCVIKGGRLRAVSVGGCRLISPSRGCNNASAYPGSP